MARVTKSAKGWASFHGRRESGRLTREQAVARAQRTSKKRGA